MCDIIHQWIRLNKPYNLMKSVFSNFEINGRKPKNIQTNSEALVLSRQALQTDGKLFPNFEFIFEILAETRTISSE